MKLKTYNCTYTKFIFSTLPVFITPEIKTQLFALKMLGKYTLKYTTCTLQTPPPQVNVTQLLLPMAGII